MERGTDVRTGGVNLVLADFFDCGLLKDNFLFLLEKLRKNVMTKDCLVVPAAATVYCMGEFSDALSLSLSLSLCVSLLFDERGWFMVRRD